MEMNDGRVIWRSSLGSSLKSSRKMTKEEAMTKHAIAEKIRRIRLKQRFREILRLFPTINKRDKASILKEAVTRLCSLKRTTAHILTSSSSSSSSAFVQYLPNEDDEATVVTANSHGDDDDEDVAKVTISCNQRGSLNRELTEAIKLAGGKQIGVDMATIAGRTKVVAMVKWMDRGDGLYKDRHHQMMSLTKAVRALIADSKNSAVSSGLVGFNPRI